MMSNYIQSILTRTNVPKDLVDRLDQLNMRPGDWGKLDEILFYNDYRDVVNDYQRREQRNLPRCTSLFKVCIYSHGGKCTGKGHCPFKR